MYTLISNPTSSFLVQAALLLLLGARYVKDFHGVHGESPKIRSLVDRLGAGVFYQMTLDVMSTKMATVVGVATVGLGIGLALLVNFTLFAIVYPIMALSYVVVLRKSIRLRINLASL